MIARDEIAAHDIRLQPDLMAACVTDIEQTCSGQLQKLLDGQRTLDRKTFGSPNGTDYGAHMHWIRFLVK